MPIFSYNCQKCNNEFELLVGVTADKADLECPKCKSKSIKKVTSSFSVRNTNTNDSRCTTGTCSTGKCPTCF